MNCKDTSCVQYQHCDLFPFAFKTCSGTETERNIKRYALNSMHIPGSSTFFVRFPSNTVY